MKKRMERLCEYAGQYGLELDGERLRLFQLYYETLMERNQAVNLTAITAPEEVAIKHFLDSIIVLRYMEIPCNERILDVGTGAGFPTLPLKIVRPDLELTLLDSLQKRVGFLAEMSAILNQDNELLHGRAEDFARTGRRESYRYVVSRAVAPLGTLYELTLPFLAPEGVFIAWKGGEVEAELEASKYSAGELGGQVMDIKRYALPNGNKRSLVMVKKISRTPTKYPRKPSIISKRPL